MNLCEHYQITCVFALSGNAPVPCIGEQEQCDDWHKKWKDQHPKEYAENKKRAKRRQKLIAMAAEKKYGLSSLIDERRRRFLP